MKFLTRVTETDIKRIRSFQRLQNSVYHNLDIAGTLDFFTCRYVQPLARISELSHSVVVDCAAGFGWFSIAYLMAGGKAAIAIDVDTERLEAAKEIAKVFSVADRMEFISSKIEDIPSEMNEADFFVSIETLEHVGRKNIRAALQRIKGIASKGVVITTPNKFFPIVAHDTRLPFIHWLHPDQRNKFANIFNREDMDQGNEFLSPIDLSILFDKFRPFSKCLTFQNYGEYRKSFPLYLPYGANEEKRRISRPSLFKATYYKVVSDILGIYSYWSMPSLTRIFVRK